MQTQISLADFSSRPKAWVFFILRQPQGKGLTKDNLTPVETRFSDAGLCYYEREFSGSRRHIFFI